MKILFDHPNPFLLAHGGFQIQIEQTKRALEEIGVAVDYVRWWDGTQRGDIIHFFGVAPPDYLKQVCTQGMKSVQTALFTETCNRSDLRLAIQGAITRAFLALPAATGIKDKLRWESFGLCDLNIVGLEAERRVLDLVYGVAPERIASLPLGLSPEFFQAKSGRKEDALISTGTITERKNTVELAQMARAAQVPILFVGKPYSESDRYWMEFARLIDNQWVRHQGHVENPAELAALYAGSRGFVMMSRYENWCLAAHEAAACGLPLLLPRQEWSVERFGNEASYFSGQSLEQERIELKTFYDRASTAPAPRVKLYSWTEVAQKLKGIYEHVLSASR